MTRSADTVFDVSSTEEGQMAKKTRAAERIRTADPFITSEVLYQLSYGGVGGRG